MHVQLVEQVNYKGQLIIHVHPLKMAKCSKQWHAQATYNGCQGPQEKVTVLSLYSGTNNYL